jgi:type II secretory pathway pseudopilin PulG
LELTVVIMVIMAMIGATMYFGGNIDEWRRGKEASEALREVYAAQRAFLADNPRRTLGSLTDAELVPYLPSRGAALPSPEDLDGAALTVNVKVSPPTLLDAGGTTYDPSGSGEDSLWDVGK